MYDNMIIYVCILLLLINDFPIFLQILPCCAAPRKACGQGKPNAPVAAGMVKGPPLSPTSTVNTMALPHQ